MPPLNKLSKSCLALALSQFVATPTHSATIVVNDDGDVSAADSKCTLREAMVSAQTNPNNALSGCTPGDVSAVDEITFDSSVFPVASTSNTITLASALPEIPPFSAVTISGHGNEGIEINANNSGRPFSVNNATVTLNKLTIRGGIANRGGALYARNSANITLSNCTLHDNSASGFGGAIFVASQSEVTLDQSTVSSNVADVNGGGIYVGSNGSINVTNTTISDNSGSYGGGINSQQFSNVSISNSTLSSNSATDLGAGINIAGSTSIINSTFVENSAAYGGAIGINPSGSLAISNSIIAGNSAPIGSGITSYASSSNIVTSTNLFGASESTQSVVLKNFTPSSSDIIATSDGTLPTKLTEILSSLDDNGGPTKTHALIDKSPAVDAGDSAVCVSAPINNSDQRGESREEGSSCDIGSFELPEKIQTHHFVIPIRKGKTVIIEL